MRPGPYLTVLVALAALSPATLASQTPEWTRRPSLRFLTLKAGEPLAVTNERIADLYGTPLRCTSSRMDARVADCRARFPEPVTGREVDVWLSSIDSLVAILTVSGAVTPVQLQAWRSSLESAYRDAEASSQGTQVSMQWIRHRQMLRLTWRDFSD